MQFAVGSTVKLKSGSPDLKVVDASGYYVMVGWVGSDGREERHVWRDVCLVPTQ